jgi:hypothetical protein
MIANGELVKTLTETVASYFKVLLKHLLKKTMEKLN